MACVEYVNKPETPYGKARCLGKIELDVWEFNESAIEFYQAVGFRQMRRWMEYEVQ